MQFYPTERIALFIDGVKLYYAARNLGFDIDYKKLHTLFKEQGVMIRAYYYTALLEDQEYSPLRPLIDWLDYNGFTVVTKPAKEYTDSSGKRRVKGDIAIDLTVDALDLCDNIDHLVIFSGDGDLCPLVAAAQRRGKRVSVVSTIKTSPQMIADDLRRITDQFIELDSLRSKIARAPSTRHDDDDDDYDDDEHVEAVHTTVSRG